MLNCSWWSLSKGNTSSKKWNTINSKFENLLLNSWGHSVRIINMRANGRSDWCQRRAHDTWIKLCIHAEMACAIIILSDAITHHIIALVAADIVVTQRRFYDRPAEPKSFSIVFFFALVFPVSFSVFLVVCRLTPANCNSIALIKKNKVPLFQMKMLFTTSRVRLSDYQVMFFFCRSFRYCEFDKRTHCVPMKK